MTVWEILACVFTFWLILAFTSWMVFVMMSRRKALAASIELKRLAVEKRSRWEEQALGAMAEGTGRVPGDSEEAAIEARAIRRMRGV